MDAQALKAFLALPLLRNEVWQGGVATLSGLPGLSDLSESHDTASDGVGLILWRCEPSFFAHAQPLFPGRGSQLEQFLDSLLALSEAREVPCRPARIECNDRQLAEGLSRLLEGSGIEVHHHENMVRWDEMVRNMINEIAPDGATSLSSLPSLREAGCTDLQIAEFATAAAKFYRAELWELLDDTDLLTVETPKPLFCLRHAVVLGAGGQSYGLGFYEYSDDHYALRRQEADPRQMDLFSMTYESPARVAAGDRDLWKELRLPLETGDAFPDPVRFTSVGPRCPTPRELVILTVVLQGLAETTEAQIDSGRWAKEVRVGGRRRKCAFAIDNLLNPPDFAEWVRRGMTPDRRGFEIHHRMVQQFVEEHEDRMDIEELNAEINARFVGVKPESYQLPRNTPAERAEALCQEAFRTYGRRRVQLAREALAEDPSHADACVLLSESMRDPERCIALLGPAKESAATALGEEFDELVGDFWQVGPTRPYLRVCEALALAFVDAGRVSDAIEQYRELLRLNPNDNQGARYEVVPLLLEQSRDGEALEVLDLYPEETAQWLYTRALVEFRQSGRSTAAAKRLRAAFKANPHVMDLLQSDDPPLSPDSYSIGGVDEAVVCIEALETVWEETDDYLDWMFQEHFTWERDQAKRRRDMKRRQRKSSDKRRR